MRSNSIAAATSAENRVAFWPLCNTIVTAFAGAGVACLGIAQHKAAALVLAVRCWLLLT